MADIQKASGPDDPRRCQGVMATKGQCMNRAVEGGTMCLAHGGAKQLNAMNDAEVRNYRLKIWQSRLDRMVDSPAIKSLRDEIGILRIVLESQLNKCTDETDLILQSGRISDLVVKIEKLVVSCNKTEASLGQLMDKSTLLRFASAIVDVISDEIDDSDKLERISAKIMESLATNDSITAHVG